MDFRRIAIPVTDVADERALLRLLRDLHVSMDPCAGDPLFETDEKTGGRRLLVIVNPRHEAALRDAGRPFDVVRDFADTPDPIRYVSTKNRYADELARLRKAKGGR
jgi:hypothetical protein